jgi:hypothetical protein
LVFISKSGREASEKKIKIWRKEKYIYMCVRTHKKKRERRERKEKGEKSKARQDGYNE